jgi:hypothetical protein
MATNQPVPTTTVVQNTSVPFPTLVFAGIIVAAGVWYVDSIDSRAGWGLAILIVLIIAFSYPSFDSELQLILQNLQGKTGAGNQTNPTPGSIGSVIPSPNGVVDSPTGNTATA